MKLYFAPGTCSFSPHIALHEAGKILPELDVERLVQSKLVPDVGDCLRRGTAASSASGLVEGKTCSHIAVSLLICADE